MPHIHMVNTSPPGLALPWHGLEVLSEATLQNEEGQGLPGLPQEGPIEQGIKMSIKLA